MELPDHRDDSRGDLTIFAQGIKPWNRAQMLRPSAERHLSLEILRDRGHFTNHPNFYQAGYQRTARRSRTTYSKCSTLRQFEGPLQQAVGGLIVDEIEVALEIEAEAKVGVLGTEARLFVKSSIADRFKRH